MLIDKPYPTWETHLVDVYGYYFPRRGHEFTWILPPAQGTGGAHHNYNTELHENVRVLVTSGGAHIHSTFSFTAARIINHTINLIQKTKLANNLMKVERFDLVQARNRLWDGVLGVYLKKRYSVPFVFQYTFPIPEGFIWQAREGMVDNPYLVNALGYISKPLTLYVMKHADLILAISDQLKLELIKDGVPEQKIYTFPMGVGESKFSKVSGRHVREKYSLSMSAPVIIYLGNMYKLRQLDFLMKVVAEVKKTIPEIILLMVGEGDDRLRLQKLSKDMSLGENVIFTGEVPSVSEYIAAADIGVSPFAPVPVLRSASPTKLIEYMAVGKPVVCNDIPDQKAVIGASGGGICTHYDIAEFADAIIYLIQHEEVRRAMGRKGQRWVRMHRHYRKLTEELEQRYWDIL